MEKGQPDEDQRTSSVLEEFRELCDRGGAPPDVDAFLARHHPVPVEVRLEVLLCDMHHRWNIGCPRPVADYLRADPELAADPARKVDLVYEEFRIRKDRGDRPAADDYFDRFPEIRRPLEKQLRVAVLLVGGAEETLIDPRRGRGLPHQPDVIPPGEASPSGLPQERTDPGELLTLNDFILGEPFPPGGMGVVYRAHQKSLDRPVALKFLAGLEKRAPGGPKRLLAEAQVLARLEHPHIVHVWGFGYSPERGYFVAMELVDGPSLAQRLKSGPLGVRQAAGYAADVAEAIHHAHQRQILHRDLKPGNVLLDLHAEAGSGVKVTDFGLALRLDPDAASSTAVDRGAGTPYYLAPEQAKDGWGPLGPWTDVYGLGGLLFALLAGRPPYLGDTLEEIRAQVVSPDPPPRLRMHRRGVSPRLEAIVTRCLAKDPTDRYRTADAVARALRDWLGRRRRLRALALGTAVVATVGLTGLGFALRPAPPPAVPMPLPPVEVVALEVLRGEPGTDLLKQPADVLPGDTLSIRGELSRPGYPYLFLVDTEGVVERLYPAGIADDSSRVVERFTGPPPQQAIRLDGRAGTVVAVLITSESRLSKAELDRLETVLKTRGPFREQMVDHSVLVNGLTPQDWVRLNVRRERDRGIREYRLEAAVNAELDSLRATLRSGDRGVEIMTLRQGKR
jgi:hypothetical protein